MVTKTINDIALRNAGLILKNGLCASKGSCVFLLAQDNLKDVAEAFEHAARRDGIDIEKELFSRSELLRKKVLSHTEKRWIGYASSYHAMLFLTEWSPETTGARLGILRKMANSAVSGGVGSIPGITLNHLAKYEFKFHEIVRYCMTTFSVLAPSKSALLITSKPDNPLMTDILVIPFSEHPPIMSTGRISPRMWGNCPSGETFILPQPYKANGGVYIDGSLPRRALSSREWCHLKFKKGRVVDEITASSPDLRNFTRSLFFGKTADRVACKNSNALSEFGIGTNPGITKLCGNPVFDEKMLGTAHIAMGSNEQFGGSLKSKVHHDLICLRPTVLVNDVMLLSQGCYIPNTEEPCKQPSDFKSPMKQCWKVRRGRRLFTPELSPKENYETDYVYDPKDHGRWYATYCPSRGPRVHLQISKPSNGPFIEKILGILDEKPEEGMSISDILHKLAPHDDMNKVLRLLRGLEAYALVERI